MKITKKILENNGMIAVIAENGDTAIAKLQTEIFDLVLMDINMPGKDGIETTQEIRKFDQITPIVALTAIEVEEMRTRIETSGMNDIIVKPYDTDKFLKIILSNLVDEEDLVFGGEHTSAGQ